MNQPDHKHQMKTITNPSTNVSTTSALFALALLMFSMSCTDKKTADVAVQKENDISQFLGQWTIDIDSGKVGWLEVRQEDGYLDADLLWESGSVQPVPYLYAVNNTLIVGRNNRRVVRTRNEAGEVARAHQFPSWLQIKSEGDHISGFYLRPKSSGVGFDSVFINGMKLPLPERPDMSKASFGQPINLLNGNDLTGWKLTNPRQVNGWSVVDGMLVNNPVQEEGERRVSYGNLMTEQQFEDFNLKLEVNVPARSNSGIYLRGRHEIQVSDSYGRPLDSHNMGALYSRITPSVNAEKPAGEWQTMDITLYKRHVTVILNGKTIIDNQPVYGPTGGALTSDVFAPGPLYLQGDHGKVSYRNIVLTPIVD